MLLADAARSTSAALHQHEQHDHAENIAEHGGGGLWLHVTPHCPEDGQGDGLVTLGYEKTKDETIDLTPPRTKRFSLALNHRESELSPGCLQNPYVSFRRDRSCKNA